MNSLLVLVHRIPFPPKKGDKVRTYNIVKNLSRYYRIHLGAFVDDVEDWQYTSDVESICEQAYFAGLNPLIARFRSVGGLLTGEPLTLAYYRDRGMRRWVSRTLREHPIQRVLVFCSSMAQYIDCDRLLTARTVIDFIDIDSDKWRQYARQANWPARWIYQRESRCLENYERTLAKHFSASVFVSPDEAEMFRGIVGDARQKVFFINNGVDSDYFDPGRGYENPYPSGCKAFTFTGAMDYWANVDAVRWFADEVFPQIHANHAQARFYIVGAKPTATVLELGRRPGVQVTGSVADVRPFLAHAVVAVAPMRIARGVQNKVLEALAMGKTVLTTPAGLEGISGTDENSVLVLVEPREFVDVAGRILSAGDEPEFNRTARDCVLQHYNWDQNLSRMKALLEGETEAH